MTNPYHLHSGGALGADLAWEQLGKESGLPLEVRHWQPKDYRESPPHIKRDVDLLVRTVAEVLKRPSHFTGIIWVQRNYFQAYHCQALFAISTIIPPGGMDRGFPNTSGKEVVAGGTGWAVEMAIQMGKPVYVFDQVQGKWFIWIEPHKHFCSLDVWKKSTGAIPTLTSSFAGIGSRNLLPNGREAIRQVYLKTLTHENQS